MRRIFIDTEFTNLPWTGSSELLWVGLADEQGNAWSAINADVRVDGSASQFIRDVVVPRMTEDEPRLAASDLGPAIRDFCAEVDEFWAWCPTVDTLADFFGLGEEAPATHARFWDWDLQLLRRVVEPWPPAWPTRLRDLNKAASTAGVIAPVNESAHHPRHDALWNLQVFKLIRARPQR